MSSAFLGLVASGPPGVPHRIRVTLILGALIALGPLTIDTYLPALPRVGVDLAAAEATVQLTLTGTLLGIALGQIVIGPLSDAWGRRLPLLAGTALHMVSCAAVGVTPTIEVLAALRVLQGIGASAGLVVGLAVVRDLYTGRQGATMLSRLLLVLGVFPVIAPTLGGFLLGWTSWRGVFLFLALYGLVMLVIVTRGLPETLPVTRRRSARLGPTLRTYGSLMTDRVFVGLVLVSGFAMAGLFSYVSGAAYVYQQQFGLDQQTFGLLFGAGAVWLLVGTQLNPVLLRRYEPRWILTVAVLAGVVVGAALFTLSATGVGGFPGLLIGVWALLLLAAFVLPNAPMLALAGYGESAGTAAALLGALQFGIGAVTTPIVGVLGNDALAMTTVMLVATTLGALALVSIVRPWQLLDLGDGTDEIRGGGDVRAETGG